MGSFFFADRAAPNASEPAAAATNRPMMAATPKPAWACCSHITPNRSSPPAPKMSRIEVPVFLAGGGGAT